MDPVAKRLIEEMRLNDREIAIRKELLGFTQREVELLLWARPIIVKELEPIVDGFIHKQFSIPDIIPLVCDRESLRRRREAIEAYLDDLFSGIYDVEYVESHIRIGLEHRIFGNEPKYFMSCVKGLKDLLRSVVVAKIPDPAAVTGVMEALEKLLYLDTEFIFETYVRGLHSQLQSAKEISTLFVHAWKDSLAERTCELEKLARVDPLTSLLNRRAFFEELQREIAVAKRKSSELALVFLDVDDFKHINDTPGHKKGDEILAAIGKTILEIKRDVDIAERHGGDEFCIILPGASLDGARTFCDRLSQRLLETTSIAVSIGIAHTGPNDFAEPEALLHVADRRMLEEKKCHHALVQESGSKF